MYADILIKNAKGLTMCGEGNMVNWIAVYKDKIVGTGRGEANPSCIGERTLVLDAEGKTVLPGFIDSHFHVVQTAFNAHSLDLNEVHSHEEIGERIRKAALENPGVQIIGNHLQIEQLREKVFPSRQVLDSYCSEVPVWLSCLDYQVSMLNTYGILYFKVPFTLEGMEKDAEDVATGIFRGQANAVLRTHILNQMSYEERKEKISNIMPSLLSVGITTINAMEGGYMYSDKDADFIYDCAKDFPVDMELFYQSLDVEKIKKMGLSRIGGSLYIDGTMGARTAALSFDYADCPGERGVLRFSQYELNEFVTECYKNDLQLSLYTIGDRAIEVALNAHEYALEKTGVKGLRHRLEHVELANSRQILRAAEMGVIFSMNPTYEMYWGGVGRMYEQRLGDKYVRTNKFREIIDRGVCLVGGSDSDITEYNPLLGIASAVKHPVPQHRITVYEALEMYTSNGAYAIFEENEKGTIEKGKTADLIVLDSDILSVETDRIAAVKVLATVKSGELIYNRFY